MDTYNLRIRRTSTECHAWHTLRIHGSAAIGSVLLAGLMSGCGLFPWHAPVMHAAPEPKSEAPAPEHPAIQHGQSVQIFDPESGTEMAVLLGETYASASHRVCSKYYDPAGSVEDDRPRGVACLDDKGRWVRIPVKVHDGFAP